MVSRRDAYRRVTFIELYKDHSESGKAALKTYHAFRERGIEPEIQFSRRYGYRVREPNEFYAPPKQEYY